MLIYANHVYLCEYVHMNLLTAKWKNPLIVCAWMLFCRRMTDQEFAH